MALLSCIDCGGKVSSLAAACPHCGCPVDAITATSTKAGRTAVVRPPGSLALEIRTASGFSSVLLDQSVTLGRTKANLVVEHPDVAPIHCRLTPHADRWIIADLGGLGVFAAGRQQSETEMLGGGVVDVGGFPGAVTLALPAALSPALTARLRSPAHADLELSIEKLPLVIGRAPWADLPVNDRNVSHAHARLRLENSRLVLDDLQSRNGTFVGDTKVSTGHPLAHGDRVRMGETELVIGDAPRAESVASAKDASPPADGKRRAAGLGSMTVAARPYGASASREAAGREGACPACKGPFELRRGAVAARASGTSERTRARIGHCSNCGVRMSACPTCAAVNDAPDLVARIACRECGEAFEAG